MIPYLTPFFAALGIIFFYAFVRKLFSKQVALVSALILSSFPVYFFYTVRSMFHNVLFVFFLLAGAYFLLLSFTKEKEGKKRFFHLKLGYEQICTYLFSLLTGIFFGLAIGARSSELLWLAPTLFVAWLFYIKRLGLTRLVLMMAGFILALLPIFYWNQILYSSPFYGGYSEMNSSIKQLSQAGSSVIHANILQSGLSKYGEVFKVVKDNIFYFGYHPYQSLKMFYYYVVLMFPYLCVATFFGLCILLYNFIQKPKKTIFVYLLSWLILSFILVMYYGSWKFNDNPDPSRFTIGNSYTRYWLPMYIMAIPLASLLIVRLGNYFAYLLSMKIATHTGKRLRAMLYSLMVLVLGGIWVFNSAMFLLFGSEEGLMTLYYNHFVDKANAMTILKTTENNAIIITQYHDKQLFPERKIISALLTDDDINLVFSRLLHNYPVYYYNFAFPEKDLNYLNERKLPPAGFTINLLDRYGVFGLYRLVPIGNMQADEAGSSAVEAPK